MSNQKKWSIINFLINKSDKLLVYIMSRTIGERMLMQCTLYVHRMYHLEWTREAYLYNNPNSLHTSVHVKHVPWVHCKTILPTGEHPPPGGERVLSFYCITPQNFLPEIRSTGENSCSRSQFPFNNKSSAAYKCSSATLSSYNISSRRRRPNKRKFLNGKESIPEDG